MATLLADEDGSVWFAAGAFSAAAATAETVPRLSRSEPVTGSVSTASPADWRPAPASRQGEAARAIRRCITADGTWLIKEIRAGLPSGLSEPGGAGLGTLGSPPPALEGIQAAARHLRTGEPHWPGILSLDRQVGEQPPGWLTRWPSRGPAYNLCILGERVMGADTQLEELATAWRRDHVAGITTRELPLTFPASLQAATLRLVATLRTLVDDGPDQPPGLAFSAVAQLAALHADVTAAADDGFGQAPAGPLLALWRRIWLG